LKKLLFFLLLAPLLLASDIKTEQKIYTLIIHSLLPQKKEIKVWCDDKAKKELIDSIPKVRYILNPENADFLLLSKNQKIQTKGVKFVTNLKLLEAGKDSVVGGFFWQKGRPNILFLKKNLQKHHIKLPKSMQEYIEEDI